MTNTQSLLTGLAALLLMGAPVLAADGPPNLDIEQTCKSAASAGVNDNASQDGCLRSERSAHDEVKRRWGEFTPAAKRQCEKQFEAGGFPSYVEMVTCLELASGTGLKSNGKQGGDSVTKEPGPSQRTDPIEVLGKPAQ
ncbi:MAG: hypothetical protein Q7T93_21445 [Methylobacterium sp.]|uniref:hypothetical protein n=1 Tax=unclassified Methylobacterium TaxID=2615210 RepID=UPI00070109B8|nr:MULTISPECIES: hypothetical protein [unclassified Methylobacterium]KQP11054.1 hypothetical protein ASF28_08330 [Methylobacterium sp. Leaf99]MDO9429373.1 hypothetical protein [Methylobacterium sp.]TXM76217.1 hypothetical protein FV218_07275 [Methylobacterium sp. WL69]